MEKSVLPLLNEALTARSALFGEKHTSAFRLFNGFLEGFPELVVDLYATTLVLYNYAAAPNEGTHAVVAAAALLRERLPWLKAGIVKTRNGRSSEEKNGILLFGELPDRKVKEGGAWYGLDLCMDQDASLFLDTRNLREWAAKSLGGKTVLNTFAYTGSLGVAALSGGAERVVQLDLDRKALNLAKTSYTLNGFPIHKANFLVGDFWEVINRLKRAGDLFDCVLLDPPFFSVTDRGVVDLQENMARLINKVRPLIQDGGRLVAVNNALYLNGQAYMDSLQTLCADGYLKVADLIPVPEDFTGYPNTRTGTPITDPAPFNHSTKIAVLEVKRKK